MGFDPSCKRPTCLATLKSCDTTKQSVNDNIYIYIYIERERERERERELKNKVIQKEEFNVKVSERYNVSFLMNHDQD